MIAFDSPFVTGGAIDMEAVVAFVLIHSPTFAPYAGEARRRVPIALGALAVNAVIDVILIPDIGIVGGAIGTNVAYAIYVPAHLWICKDMLGVDLRPILVSFARALVAAAAMAGVLALFGTEDVGILALIAGSVAGLAVYLAVLLALRELTVGDLRRLAAEARARLLASRA